jgi:hypothetical protein
METQLAQIVNRAFSGEPEHICLQIIETNKIFEFSQIVGEDITNNDILHPTIQRILNQGHQVNVSFDENDNVTLHF